MAKKTIKEGKLVPLEEIRIIPDTLSRQSLVKIFMCNREKAKDEVAELMDSMKAVGQIEFIGLREIDVPKCLLEEDGLSAVYHLIYGYRRYLAAQFLGWKKIKAVILRG